MTEKQECEHDGMKNNKVEIHKNFTVSCDCGKNWTNTFSYLDEQKKQATLTENKRVLNEVEKIVQMAHENWQGYYANSIRREILRQLDSLRLKGDEKK